jgi:hypothetical protein
MTTETPETDARTQHKTIDNYIDYLRFRHQNKQSSVADVEILNTIDDLERRLAAANRRVAELEKNKDADVVMILKRNECHRSVQESPDVRFECCGVWNPCRMPNCVPEKIVGGKDE